MRNAAKTVAFPSEAAMPPKPPAIALQGSLGASKPNPADQDAELFRLHDAFCVAYAAMLKADGGGGGSLDSGTAAEKARHRKWERAVEVAADKARAVVDAPAYTLDGMLMKIHVGGFASLHYKPGTFSVPYHPAKRWEPSKFASEEAALIVSLRDDLHRYLSAAN